MHADIIQENSLTHTK